MPKIPKARFHLVKQKQLDTEQIYLIFRFKGQRLFHYTGYRVKPSNWNNDLQRVQMRVHGYKLINNHLDDLEQSTNSKFNELRNTGSQTIIPDLKKFLIETYRPEQLKPIKEVPKMEFMELLEKVNETRRMKGKTLAKGSMNAYRQLMTNLKEFQKSKKYKLVFKNINATFYDDFLQFLEKKNLSDNTVRTRINKLKAIMNEGVRLKLHNNSDFKYFEPPKEFEPKNIYLTELELKALEEIDLSANEKLEQARDLFLFGVWTYQRFSDYGNIQREQFKKDHIEIKQQKTDAEVKIPYHRIHKKLIKKYHYNLPKIHENKVNKRIKEVCQMIGMIELEQINSRRGGQKQQATKQRYELVTTHTARRTGLTHLYKATNNIVECMEMSGHTDSKNFKKYIKITSKEISKGISESSIYKESIMKKVS